MNRKYRIKIFKYKWNWLIPQIEINNKKYKLLKNSYFTYENIE